MDINRYKAEMQYGVSEENGGSDHYRKLLMEEAMDSGEGEKPTLFRRHNSTAMGFPLPLPATSLSRQHATRKLKMEQRLENLN
jgi:hypothetical protein